MVERGQHLRFALETGQPLRVVHEGVGEDLEVLDLSGRACRRTVPGDRAPGHTVLPSRQDEYSARALREEPCGAGVQGLGRLALPGLNRCRAVYSGIILGATLAEPS